MSDSAALRAVDVSKVYGGLIAVSLDEFVLRAGEIVGLIGPNGAGKSTFVDCLTGFSRPTSGRVFLGNRDVTGLRPDQLVRHGLARTFQLLELFEDLPVVDNVSAGVVSREKALQHVRELGLADLANTEVSALAHGKRQLTALGRAVVNEPKVLLLDEPASGLDPEQRELLFRTCRRYVAEGGALMVIDHDMRFVFNLCHRVYVLESGRLIAEGTPDEVSLDPAVIKAYLGTTIEAAEVEEAVG